MPPKFIQHDLMTNTWYRIKSEVVTELEGGILSLKMRRESMTGHN